MILILLSNQLFPLNLLPLKDITLIYIVEEPRYFTDYDFHKLKLIYHRASMKKYLDKLSKKVKCIYKEYKDVTNQFYDSLNKDTTYYFNPIDHKLEKQFNKLLSKATKLENINFLLTPTEIEENKNVFYRNNKYSHDLFYKFQRNRLDILIHNNKPVGGKWSFDTENRLPYLKILNYQRYLLLKKINIIQKLYIM